MAGTVEQKLAAQGITLHEPAELVIPDTVPEMNI